MKHFNQNILGSGTVKTLLLFRCKIKYGAGQARQPVTEKLSVKAYREPAFLLHKFPAGNLQNRSSFAGAIPVNGRGKTSAAGVQRAVSPLCKGTGSAASLCRSRAAAIAQ